MIPASCAAIVPDTAWMLPGRCPAFDAALPVDSRRQRKPYSDKGMVSNQTERLSSPESRHGFVRLNVSTITHLCANPEALNGRF
jgi:hypothetical protein